LGGFSSNLGPTDGQKSIGIGATYTLDAVKITGAVRYVELGDTSVTLDDVNASATFAGNYAVAVGFRIGYTF
jgi:long-chain fatty acid transport protein